MQIGTYMARPAGAALQVASTGTEQVAVRFTINGESITWWGFLTDKTIDRTIESLRIMGWKGDDLSDLSTVTEECEIVVQAKDDGRFEVRWINRPGARALKQLDPAEAKSVAQRLRDRVRAYDRAAAEAGSGSTGFGAPREQSTQQSTTSTHPYAPGGIEPGF